MSVRLDGQVAVVTGGTGQLGGAISSAFRDAGAHVVATARRADDAAGEGIEVAALDLLDEAAVLELAARVRERHGRLDALVCSAGGWEGGTPVHEATLELWRRQLDRNATTAFVACRAFLPLLYDTRGGAVVLVGTRGVERPYGGAAAHLAAKAAVVMLTRVLALEAKPHDVTVNAVLPSTLDTPQNRRQSPDANVEDWVPTRTFAEAVLWLCGEAGHTISGAALPLYGKA